MKKLTDERLHEIKAAANEQGKQSYEIMTNEELAAYRINCTDAMEARKATIAKYEGKRGGGTMVRIAKEGIEYMETAIAYIDEKLTPKEEVSPLDQFLNNWKEAVRTYYTNLRKELDEIQSEDPEINAENLKSIQWAYGKAIGKQKYSDSKIEKKLTSDLPKHEKSNLKVEIRRQKYNNWAGVLTNQDVNFVEMMNRIDNYLEDSLESMVQDKKDTFIKRVESKSGKIIDMNGLTLGEDGSINGKVIGDKKTVEVTTVFAGGYNVQCLHFRVLVK